ncbi:DNA-processing protein DprA [Mycoplasma flocculare]|uniref:DNA processing protein DprA (SMF) n=2 Tax=Mesomycoplasma flocculare TaxID=2128 RepID=A0A0A8E782_MESFC|nr:DNA-processing protein DprA [Mesomycoplasma flocculare]MXR39537.1 DNA-processing protein DprA [Mycoplasma sp. MF12]AJC49878.1 DNA processing protein DprA (SMF) [Mesomycoplasma flocculare ATCC 27399]ENX51214.1 DNA processing protein SMF [Mesomycoplasma flocculare ATCC 27716]MXR05991.1 DNA-processing protein DprA [Mesomycoplasma flocculare]MXR12357.1 DNA-processing protein DprA [Mesomycoplasma flocculare]
MKNKLIHYAIKYKGDYKLIQKAVQIEEKITKEELFEIQKKLDSGKINAITIVDENYPESFQMLKDPPYVLFYRGNIEFLNNKMPKSSLIGEKYNSKIQEFFNRSLDEVIKRHILVTNGYKGVEQKVMEYFRLNDAPIIAISANGVRNPWLFDDFLDYKNVLFISEYPSDTKINRQRLIERNRLVAGLANFLVIYSIRQTGGSQNLVNYFLDFGKEIYCFFDKNDEDALDYKGCSDLIYQGANWITEIKDIYYESGSRGE